MCRQSDYIEITSLDPLDPNKPDPLLDSIGTGFVKRPILVNIIIDLLGGETGELNKSGTIHRALLYRRGEADRSYDLMPFATQITKHFSCLGRISGFPQCLSIH